MAEEPTPPALSARQQYAVIAAAGLVALILGIVLAPTVFGTVSDATQGTADQRPDQAVAVVSIEGPITAPLGEEVEKELGEVRRNDSVEAVVLKLDTPGGQPAPSEQMYKAVQRTSEQMPVIASVQSASASGGYYAMLPAEDIYVLPTSITGSVGLAASAPQQSPPIEGPSGPDKRGLNEIEGWARQELLAQVFIETVMENRGDRIELSREEVATADIFLGIEAVDNGMADEIGSLEDAIKDAAERADLEEYEVVRRDTSPDVGLPILVQTEQGIVKVSAEDPGYGDVEPVPSAFVYEPGIPHHSTIEEFVESDVNVDETAGEGGEAP